MFATNFWKAYGGQNIVKHQIGYPSNDQYTIEGSNVELPLGREFQDLVSCFIYEYSHHSADFRSDTKKEKQLVAPVSMKKKLERMKNILHHLHHSFMTSDLSERQKLEQEKLDIKSFQILRALMHNEIVKVPSIQDEGKLAIQRHQNTIKDMQNALASLNIVDICVPHMIRNADLVLKEVIALLETLLYNGNANVQNAFYNFFMSTKEETFFRCVHKELQRCATIMKEQKALMSKEKHMLKARVYIRSLMKQKSKSKRAKSVELMSSKTAQAFKSKKISPFFNKTDAAFIEHELERLPSMTEEEQSTLILDEIKDGKKQLTNFQECSDKTTDSKSATGGDNQQLDDTSRVAESDRLELLLRALALLCDGQNTSTQDYLREQKDNIRSVNIIAETARFLQVIYSSITFQNISLATQLFGTLIEFCQGNFTNQMVIFDQKVIDFMNFILRKSSFPGCTGEEILELKKAIATLIRTLIEENSASGHARIISESLNKEYLYQTMLETYNMLTEAKNMDQQFRDLVETVGFLYCHIMCRCFDLEGSKELDKYCNCPAWHFFLGSTLSVELVKNESLQKVHFRVKDKNLIRNYAKEKLNWEVDRSSPTNKLQDFMLWCRDIRKDLYYQRKINAFFLGRALVQAWRPLNTIVIVLSFIINILVLVSWGSSQEYSQPSAPVADSSVHKWALFGFGIAHNIFSFLLLMSYLLSQKPVFPRFSKRFVSKRERQSHFEVKLISFRTFYYLMFFILSLAGSFIPSIFAVHLLHIAANNQLLSRVIKAVTLNGRSLLWVAFMGLIIIYIYALIGYTYLREVFDDNRLFCRNMWECFCTMIREGLIYGLTERFDISPKSVNFNFQFYALKMLFDVSFFVLVTTIGLNIVFGIIVDTFSELRDNKWQIENDMNTTCFICGKRNFEFEHHGKSFTRHLTEEHNMWSYVYFFIHLDDTPENDLTALELHVFNLMKKDRYDFFPLGRALALSTWDKKDADSRLEHLLEQVNILVSRSQKKDALKVQENQRRQQEAWRENISCSKQPLPLQPKEQILSSLKRDRLLQHGEMTSLEEKIDTPGPTRRHSRSRRQSKK